MKHCQCQMRFQKRSQILWAVPIFFLSLLLLGGCNTGDDAQKVDFKVPVSVTDVGLGDVFEHIVVTGTLRAAEVVTLVVETGGSLEVGRSASGRQLAEGDRVAVGDVVAEVTGEDVRLAARMAATRQRFEAALSDFEATQELLEQGLITDTEVRSKSTALEDARLEYDRSRRSEARNRLVTPIAGVILSLARDAQGQRVANGQLVTPGFTVAQIAKTKRLTADVDLVGTDVARVEISMPAEARHHAWADRLFDGEVIRIAPTIDSSTRALRAEVEIDNRDGLLKPGMFVEVTLVGEEHLQVPVVPRDSITDRGGKKVVFVLRGQSVARREVKLGLGDDEIVEVIEGVEVGERVVTRGIETLKDKMRVRVSGNR